MRHNNKKPGALPRTEVSKSIFNQQDERQKRSINPCREQFPRRTARDSSELFAVFGAGNCLKVLPVRIGQVISGNLLCGPYKSRVDALRQRDIMFGGGSRHA